MDTQKPPTLNGKSAASWWIMVLAALLIGGIIGYYLGSSGVGTGLVPEAADKAPSGQSY